MSRNRAVPFQIGRALLDGSGGAPLRRFVMDAESRRENEFVVNRAAQSGVRAFDWRKLRSAMKTKLESDTFFVLGSGSSVEELSPSNFDEIGRNVSVGINNWPLHPFVPDIYSFESVPRVGDGKDLHRALAMLARVDILERRPHLLLLRPRAEEDRGIVETVPAPLREQLFYYGRISPAARAVPRLAGDIAHFFRRVASKRHAVLLDSGASVVRMAVLGLLLGYRKITFVGVDLTGSSYFWEANPSYLKGGGGIVPSNNQQPGGHETLSRMSRPFSVLEMIEVLALHVKGSLGGRVSVASSSSALAGFLPLHTWSG